MSPDVGTKIAYVERMGTNRTSLKSFDRLARDPRVAEIRDEGSDRYWVDLMPGYTYKDCISIHGETVAEIFAQMRWVEQRSDAQHYTSRIS